VGARMAEPHHRQQRLAQRLAQPDRGAPVSPRGCVDATRASVRATDALPLSRSLSRACIEARRCSRSWTTRRSSRRG
jgi:hypothetical protein